MDVLIRLALNILSFHFKIFMHFKIFTLGNSLMTSLRLFIWTWAFSPFFVSLIFIIFWIEYTISIRIIRIVVLTLFFILEILDLRLFHLLRFLLLYFFFINILFLLLNQICQEFFILKIIGRKILRKLVIFIILINFQIASMTNDIFLQCLYR